MKEFIILFVLFFIIIYLFYYFLYRRKKLVYDKKTLSPDIKILEGYYKVNVKKIGYQKVLRILNFVNALMLSCIMMIVMNIDKVLYKLLIIIILIVPFIWVTYYFLAKYLKHLERKRE